jgi:hypothetical protein
MISSHAPSLAHSFAEAQTPFCRTILSATQLRPAYCTVAPSQGAIMGFVLGHRRLRFRWDDVYAAKAGAVGTPSRLCYQLDYGRVSRMC